MSDAFTAYIQSLRLAALTASIVFSADSLAQDAQSTLALTTAAASTAVGKAAASILGAGVGVANGIIIPATNAAIVSGMKGAACLVNAAQSLLIVCPRSIFPI